MKKKTNKKETKKTITDKTSDKFYLWKDVKELTDMKRTEVYYLMSKNKFPQFQKKGTRCLWKKAAVAKWVDKNLD